MQRIILALLVAILFGLAAVGQSKNSSAPGDANATAPGAKLEIRPVPPELLRRSANIRAVLQSSAKTWIEQQAKIEARRPDLDLNALQTAIHQRFASSLSPAGLRKPGPAAALQDNGAVAAVAVMVILKMVQDGDKDLQAQIQDANAMMQAKQQLRNLLDQMNQELAAGKASPRNGACATAFCRSLPAKLAQIDAAGSKLLHPIHLQAPANITWQQLAALQSVTNQALDSDNEISEMGSMRLQMLMDARTKLLQAASDLEKSISDTDMAIVGNLK
jgi:hypothetical protein